MSRLSVLSSLLAVGAASLIAAPAANAYTEEPLGRCTLSGEGAAKLESITIPGTTSVAPDGTGRGSLGVTVRSGGPNQIELFDIVVLGPNGQAAGQFTYEGSGCARVRIPLAEIGGLKLRKGSAYVVSVRSYPWSETVDPRPMDPISGAIQFYQRTLQNIRGGFLAQ